MATFITSKSVGQTIRIYAETSTGYWKYNHDGSDSSANSNGETNNIQVTNSNGEFTIISCDSDGTVNGDVTILSLGNKQITSFDGTGLSSLITLELNDNRLTSFDGTGLSSLTRLVLESNLLTSFDGNGLTSLTLLGLQNNLITSFDGTGLSSLNALYLGNNLLTIFDVTGLSSLHVLYLNGNPMTPEANNQILQQLNQLSVSGGDFGSNNGRTAASNADYNNLLTNLGWSFSGLDLPPPTFITSKAVGETIDINVDTTTGYFKYNHDGVDSEPLTTSLKTITITNANGEFTIKPCDSNGNVTGDITSLNLENIQITSFNSAGLSSLQSLMLGGNQLTSIDVTGLSNLTILEVGGNQLTSLDVSGLSNLTTLSLNDNWSMTPSANNQILQQLNQHGVSNGYFGSANGRYASSNTDYNNLVSLGWTLEGLDLVATPTVGNGRLAIRGIILNP